MNGLIPLFKTKRFWISFVSVFAGLIFLLWPSFQIDFAYVTNQKDLQLLRGLYLEIQSIENWKPRFASQEQCNLLVERIRSDETVTSLRDLLRVSGATLSAQGREALEYQNSLIRELEKNGQFPQFSKIRKMKLEKAQAVVKGLVDTIVEEERHRTIDRILHFSEVEQKKGTRESAKNRFVRLQNLFWMNDMDYCPENSRGWFGTSWSAMDRWVVQFQKAVEKDVLPLFQWYQDIEAFSTLNLEQSSQKNFLQLRLQSVGNHRGDFVRDGWCIRGNYALFLCSSEENMIREMDTGIRHTPLQLLPDKKKFPRSKISANSSLELYSSQTGHSIRIHEGLSTYHPAEVSQFLYQLGVPSGFSVRILKVSTSQFLDKITISYNLEHSDVPDWKSTVFTLPIEAENCSMEILQAHISLDMKTAQNDFWRFASSKLDKLKLFSCRILEVKDENQIMTELTAGKIRLPWLAVIDDTAHFRYFCNASAEDIEPLLEKICQVNQELEKIKGFLSIDSLRLDKNITGRCVISSNLWDSDVPNDEELTFDFWINPEGFLDTNSLTVLKKLATHELKQSPEPKEEISPEKLKARIQVIIQQKYPALAEHIQVLTGSCSTTRVYYQLFLELADYPVLQLGSRNFIDDATLQNELDELLDGSSDGGMGRAVQNQWADYDHPFYGEIRSQLKTWTPTASDGNVGVIENTFFPAKVATGFSWEEPLFVENGGWIPRDWESVTEQLGSQWEMLCQVTSTIAQKICGAEFQIHPEMEDDWIQSTPLKFSMKAQWQKPLGLPIHLEVGKIRVTAQKIEFPKQLQLSGLQTFWTPTVGISWPHLDLDFEKQRFAAGFSITPPLNSLGENIPEEGYSLEEYESPEVSEEEYLALFGETLNENEGDGMECEDDSENTESSNPWLKWIRMDVDGQYDGLAKEIGLGGAMKFVDTSSAAVSGSWAPSRFQGGLSTRSMIENESQDTSVPLDFKGDFSWLPEQTDLEAMVNFNGYSGTGGFSCQTRDEIKYSGNFATPLPLAFPQLATVGGDVSPNMEHYHGEASGIVLHPFIQVLGSLKYGLRIWRVSEADSGCKLVFEWIMPDGRKATFEKEYPHADSLTPEELEKEIREEYERLLEEEEFEAQTPTEAESEQFTNIGQMYSEVEVSSTDDAAGMEDKMLKKQLSAVSEMPFEEFQASEDAGESSNTITPIRGDISVYEENGNIVFQLAETKQILFQINKGHAGLQPDENVRDYRGWVGTAKNGSGMILLVSLRSLTPGTYPRFIRISCDSPRTVRQSEEISSNNFAGRCIQPLFPTVLSSDFTHEIHAILTAMSILWDEGRGHQTQNPYRSENYSSFDDETLEQTCFCYLAPSGNDVQPQFGVIPHEVISDSATRQQVIQTILKPDVIPYVLDRMVIEGFLEHDDTYSLLWLATKAESNDLFFQFFTPSLPVRTSIFHPLFEEKTNRGNAYFQWILQQYISGTILEQESSAEFFLGNAGIVVLETESLAAEQKMYLISELNISEMEHSPVVLTSEDWKVWKQNTIRFLPQDLQREDARERLPLAELATLAVQSWNRDDAKDVQKWRASPLGLLISLAKNQND